MRKNNKPRELDGAGELETTGELDGAGELETVGSSLHSSNEQQ